MADIQRKLVKWGKRNVVSRHFHAKDEKETMITWMSDLDKILQIFNVRFVIRAKKVANFPVPEGTYDECEWNRFRRSA